MRKMLFAFAILVTGAFAFAAGSPASAATVNPITGMSNVVQSTETVENVGYRDGYYRRRYYDRGYYRRRGYCYYYPWRCRGRDYYYRRHYYRPWWW